MKKENYNIGLRSPIGIDIPFKGLRTKKTDYEKKALIEKGKDIITIRLNLEERDMIDKAKKLLMVDRDGTALKELAELGNSVLHDSYLGKLIQKIIRRIRKGYDLIV